MRAQLASPDAVALHAECRTWAVRTGTAMARLSLEAGLDSSFIASLLGRGCVSPDAERAVRQAMADHPRGIAHPYVRVSAPLPVREAVPQAPVLDPAEANARDRAPRRRITPEYRARLRHGSCAEHVATACVETPSELIATVTRQWPGLWERVVAEARAVGMLPGAMLVRVIERGLEADA